MQVVNLEDDPTSHLSTSGEVKQGGKEAIAGWVRMLVTWWTTDASS